MYHTDQIRSAREWYHWIGLGMDITGHRFFIFYFDLEFFDRVQRFEQLNAKMPPIFSFFSIQLV
jgi:hypothetical protein